MTQTETKIKARLLKLAEEAREDDRLTHEWYDKESDEYKAANKPFFHNGYVYSTDVRNAVCEEMFGHIEYKHICRGKNRPSMDKQIATDAECKAITAVIKNMAAKELIKASKSGTMVKILFT